MNDVNHPHDHFFRLVFSQVEHAADFLSNYLPAEVAAMLDLSTLQLQNDSFVDEDLRENFTDLLFSVQQRDQQPVFVYILIEHKSRPERDTAFQLLRYMVRIWERQRANAPGEALRPIILQVVYHGSEKWPIAPSFDALFAGPEALRPFWPKFNYALLDVARMSDEGITGLAMVQATLYALKYVWNATINLRLRTIMALLSRADQRPGGRQYVIATLFYLTRVAAKMEEREYQESVQAAFGQQGETIMGSVAERYIKEGVLQGMQQGMQQGVQRGRLETIIHQLGYRFGVLPAHFLARLEQLSAAQLAKVEIAILDARSLDEVRMFVDGLLLSEV
jgi:predicted transposase/invertase (TIGR01784 family)